jgi:ribonuclease Z
MMKIIPLGTSSGKPTLTRNVSAVAVTGEGEWWLFDCGEGTQMQIARARLSANRLAGVFITHLHGDHFNGLAGLLSSMGLDRRERGLVLVGPPGIGEYLETLKRLKILFVNFPLELREVGAADFAPGRSSRLGSGAPALDAAGRVAAGGESASVYESARYTVVARPLDHRVFALGYRVAERTRPGRFNLERARALGIPEGPLYGRLQSGHDVQLADGRIIHPADVLGPPRPGKSVAYCLDTRPCADAKTLARGVDWLIHEATYTEDLIEEARDYGHSTAAQAARTAREAGARRLLITHISTRYPDAALLLEEARAVFPATTLAEDLMELEV